MEKFGYRRMFSDLDPYYPQPKDLNKLAAIMSGQLGLEGGNSAISTNLPTANAIPAGYTYLGQFITHEISLDEKSNRHKKEDLPWEIACPEQIGNLRNLRKPAFDLETIYGYENPTNEGETPRAALLHKHPLPLLKLGVTEREIGGGTAGRIYPCDLPRGAGKVKAEIVDSRNDENLLIAQTQVAFIKFHNALVVSLAQSGKYTDDAGQFKTRELFEMARELTIRYYQTIVLTDFLPRFVQPSVLKDVLTKAGSSDLYYQPTADDLFMPLEFAVGAFRFGHSMIRRNYRLNIKNSQSSLGELMAFTGSGNMGSNVLARRLKLPSIWIIDWNLFYQINAASANSAEPINTELIFDLLRLPPEGDDNPDVRVRSLAALDLYRGRRFGLPTGQDIAAKYEDAKVLSANEIAQTINARKIETATEEAAKKVKAEMIGAFGEKTPLWFYILAEAELQNDGRLGTVGSRIVAETILQLLYYSESSILREDWGAGEDFLLDNNGAFGMPEMFGFINKINREHHAMVYPEELYPNVPDSFDEINPLENG